MERMRTKSLYPWLLVAMLWCVCFFNYADRQAIYSIFPLLRTQLGLSSVQLGVVASCFMWVYALAGPLAGWASDRISPRIVVLAALTFWSLVTATTALCHTYGSLVFVRSLGGLGEAFYFPAAMSLIAAVHTATTRSRAMAIHQSSVYAGTIGGSTFSALIAEQYGWHTSFILFGLLGVALAVGLVLFLRPTPPNAASPTSTTARNLVLSIRKILASRRVLAMIAVFMGANFVAVVFLTWLPTFLGDKFHMSLGNAGFSSTIYLQLASVAGVLLGGILVDSFAAKGRGGRQAVQAAGLLGGVPFLFLTGWSITVTGLIAAMIGFGFFKGIYDANIWASLYDVIPEDQRGLAAGLMNSLGWLGGGFAPILIAALANHSSLSACLSAMSAIYLLVAAVLFLVARSLHRSPTTAF